MDQPSSELSEKDFIQDDRPKNPKPFWFWVFTLTLMVFGLYALNQWYQRTLTQAYEHNAFLQVTNREMSVFLWQFSEHMRPHVKAKTGYLPGFEYINHVGMELETADDYAIAPPELLYLYHTWHRLLGQIWFERPIPIDEFKTFLEQLPEWQAQNWKGAPKSYIKLLDHLSEELAKDISASLPLIVKQAFQGWKNYFYEGDLINQTRPSFGQLEDFLQRYPHYQRHFWRNLVDERSLQYLAFTLDKTASEDAMVPSAQMSAFLRVAYYNFFQALQGQAKNPSS